MFLTSSLRRMANNVCNGSFLIPRHRCLHGKTALLKLGHLFIVCLPKLGLFRRLLHTSPYPDCHSSHFTLQSSSGRLPLLGTTQVKERSSRQGARWREGEAVGPGRLEICLERTPLSRLRASVLASFLVLPRWATKKRGLSCQAIYF